jgi:glyoxalase family protein
VQLDGIHHITCITSDARANVDFYVRVLGLRMVKKTVNFDAPEIYHLYYGDEQGSPGSILTFFEFPGVGPGRPGAGQIHRIVWRVSSSEAIEFWAHRLNAEGVAVERNHHALRFADPEGLEHELAIVATDQPPLIAAAPDIPRDFAVQGFDGVRAYSRNPAASGELFRDALGFRETAGGEWEVAGARRANAYRFDRAPAAPPLEGAGSVHHIAWACEDADQEAWRERARAAAAHVTPIIDRQYFRSIYFREPSGVLFEIATKSPGFAVDEDREHLGETLRLPPQHEHLREHLEHALTPLVNPRAAAARP